MRNGAEQGRRNAWGRFVKAAREGIGMTGTDFARAVGIDRATLWRWESGRYRPERPDIVHRVAQVTGADPEEALAAAGLRPGQPAPIEPSEPADAEIDLIRRANISDAAKRRLVKHILERRAREERTRLEELRMLIQAQERLS